MREFDESEEMRELEERLRVELGRRDAPAGFAERVLARTAKQAPVLPMSARVRGRVWMYAAAAMVLLSVTVGQRVHEVRQAQKKEQAQREFDMAMQVTGRTWEHAREQMQRAGLDLGGTSGPGTSNEGEEQ